jgi:hypothetical protein
MNRRTFMRAIPGLGAIIGIGAAGLISAFAHTPPAQHRRSPKPTDSWTAEERARLAGLQAEQRRLKAEHARRQAYVLREELDEIADATGQTFAEVAESMGIDIPKLTAMLT